MSTRCALQKAGLLIAGILVVLAPAGAAAAGEKKWRMRVVGAFSGANDGVVATSGGYSKAGVSVSGGAGGGINFEYRFSERTGFELGAMAVSGRVRVGGAKHRCH